MDPPQEGVAVTGGLITGGVGTGGLSLEASVGLTDDAPLLLGPWGAGKRAESRRRVVATTRTRVGVS